MIVGEEDYTSEEAKQVLLAAISDPRATPVMPVLIDIRSCETQRTTDELIAPVDFLESKREQLPARRAVVATADLRYRLSRLASGRFEKHGVDVEVFRNIESARQWLKAGATAR